MGTYSSLSIPVGYNGSFINTWRHVAFVKRNGNTKLYIDGIYRMESYDNANYSYLRDFNIGGFNTNAPRIAGAYMNRKFEPFEGLLNSFSISKGSALYTANFTPPPRV